MDKENNETDTNSNKDNGNIFASAEPGGQVGQTVGTPTAPSDSMENECPTCKKTNSAEETMTDQQPNFIYAIGSIRVHFPNVTIENEYKQLVKEGTTEQLIDPQVVHKILKENRYLAREVCWVFAIEGMDTYLIAPRDPLDLDQLVEAISRPDGEELDTDVMIGERGPMAPIERCGLELPVVLFDKIYSFQKKGLIKEIPKPDEVQEKPFRISSDDLFARIQQLADNVGASDEHRALNYVAVRYPQIYVHAREMYDQDYSLESIEAIPSRLSGTRKLIDIILSYQNRNTSVIDKYYIRVDVSGKYPYLQNPLTRYYHRA